MAWQEDVRSARTVAQAKALLDRALEASRLRCGAYGCERQAPPNAVFCSQECKEAQLSMRKRTGRRAAPITKMLSALPDDAAVPDAVRLLLTRLPAPPSAKVTSKRRIALIEVLDDLPPGAGTTAPDATAAERSDARLAKEMELARRLSQLGIALRKYAEKAPKARDDSELKAIRDQLAASRATLDEVRGL